MQGANFQPKFSIITPFKNVEAFLGLFLESVSRQRFQNYELILIDDGSTDRSCEISDRLAEQDRRITRLRNVKSNGPGIARNIGIRAARGEWIVFADSDDLLPNDFLAELSRLTDRSSRDAIVLCFQEFTSQPGDLVQKSGVIRHNRILRRFERTGIPNYWAVRTFPAVWTRIYRRKSLVIHDLQFLDGVHEDLLWSYVTAPAFPRMDVCLSATYLYRKRDSKDSITQLANNARFDILIQSRRLRQIGSVDVYDPALREAISVSMMANIVGVNIDFSFRDPNRGARRLFEESSLELLALRNWAQMRGVRGLISALRNPRSGFLSAVIQMGNWPIWVLAGGFLHGRVFSRGAKSGAKDNYRGI